MKLCRCPMRSALVALAGAALLAGPAAASPTCYHPTKADPAFGTLGDVNGSGAVNVADALCATLTSLVALANPGDPPWPACLSGDPLDVDLNCDGQVDISDVTALIGLAKGQGLGSALDGTGDGCADTCTPCVPGVPGATSTCRWMDASGGTLTSADGEAEVTVPAGALTAPVVMSIERVAEPIVTAPGPISKVYDIGPDGLEFAEPISLCFQVESEGQLLSSADYCPAFIDENSDPPKWRCEDHCLEQVSPSFWCGKTDHLTNFAILLGASTPDGWQAPEGCE